MLRIGIDIGGTFTDFAVWKGGSEGYREIVVFKVPSTPPNFAEAVQSGLTRLLADGTLFPADDVLIVHGTTVGTNAVIERRGPSLALLVTRGFRNLLDVARLRMDNPIDLHSVHPAPIVPTSMVFEVAERLLANGEVDIAIDAGGVERAAALALAAGAEAIAVCFVHAYRNPVHELRAREIIQARLPGVDVVLSHEIWAQEGEYERANATILNLFARGAMTGYVEELLAFLGETLPNARLLVTKSNGGAMSAVEATRYPIHSLLSGPASGVTAALTLGRMLDAPNLLTMDMGGTSTDISLVVQGSGIVSQHGKVGDFPIIMPVSEIEAIGAGGGSIAWMDGAVLKVGPRSAGARPGPACYGAGGMQPTLSDAYLLCGYLDENTPLAGEIFLRRDLAASAMQPIADALHCDVVQAAESCVVVATSNMLAKSLPFIARIGASPAELTLMIFGGAGAIHGPLLAAEIGIGKVIVPKHSSVFCAFGGLVTDLLYDTIYSARGEKLSTPLLQRAFSAMRVSAAAWLRQQAPTISPSFEYSANLRYAGQSFDVPTVITEQMVESGDLQAIGRSFYVEHLRLFKHAHENREIDAVGFQLRVRGSLPRLDTAPTVGASAGGAAIGVPRRIYIDGCWHDATCYRQASLPDQWSAAGPAVIEQTTATSIVPPNFTVSISPFGDLIMERNG